MKIHVSIVDYFKASRVLDVLKCLEEQTIYNKLSITLVDNSVCERNFNTLLSVAKKNSKLMLVRQKKNVGYVSATNFSVDSSADFVVLLNPDVLLKDHSLIEECVNEMLGNNRVGVMGIRQVTDAGKSECVARAYPTVTAQVARRFPLVNSLIRPPENFDQINELGSGVHVVDWVQSSFWVVRGELWRQLEGLNEFFYLFMAEPEFSKRASALGYSTVLNCNVCGISDGIRASAVSFKSAFTSRSLRKHVRDSVVYYFFVGRYKLFGF